MTTFSMEVFDHDVVVPSSLASITPILRIANEIESDRPRVAYLCMLINTTSNPVLFIKRQLSQQ
jgi:hypothetical protein